MEKIACLRWIMIALYNSPHPIRVCSRF